jgi:hypothetical protein
MGDIVKMSYLRPTWKLSCTDYKTSIPFALGNVKSYSVNFQQIGHTYE